MNVCKAYDPSMYVLKEFWDDLKKCFFLVSQLERCVDIVPNEFIAKGIVKDAYANYSLLSLGLDNFTVDRRLFLIEDENEKADLISLCKKKAVKCMVYKFEKSECENLTKTHIFDIYYFGYHTHLRRIFRCGARSRGLALILLLLILVNVLGFY